MAEHVVSGWDEPEYKRTSRDVTINRDSSPVVLTQRQWEPRKPPTK